MLWLTLAVLYFRMLVSGLPPLKPGFDAKPGHMEFVVDKAVMVLYFFFKYLGVAY
jgi:hypothetical protein